MITSKGYTAEFYERQRNGSRRSAEAIVPHLMKWVNPRSVVDVGCGVATWLGVFLSYDVNDIAGIDGDYVNRAMLEIPVECFTPHDLRIPLSLARTFDLVISTEVAEHLPEELAESFIKSLTTLGPVIFFSAAIPGQGGTDHLNEQWPDYWMRLFAAQGYVAVDCLRSLVWSDPNVEYWYAQNGLVYVQEEKLNEYPGLKSFASDQGFPPASRLIHPTLFSYVARELQLKRAFYESHKVPRDIDGLSFINELTTFSYQAKLLPRLLVSAIRKKLT